MKWYCWIVVPLLIGCSSSQPQEQTAILPYNYHTEYIFPRWRSLHKLNRAPLESDAHRAWIDLYVNDAAKAAYTNKSSRFPIDSIVLKPLFPDKERSSIARLVIMMKMESGYDPENGDWWYGVYAESGQQGWYTGKIASCIKCHKHAADTDYMFSESVMEQIVLQHD